MIPGVMGHYAVFSCELWFSGEPEKMNTGSHTLDRPIIVSARHLSRAVG